MTTVEIKAELQKMISEQEDMDVLQAIRTLLQKTRLNPALKAKLSSRAQKAEMDIVAGKLYTKEEIKQRSNRVGK